jgi:protease I
MSNENDKELHGLKVAFVVANEGIEESELVEPWQAILNAGGEPELVAPKSGLAGTVRHLDRAGRFPVDRVLAQIDPSDYDAVVLPGGLANPDSLRREAAAVKFLIAVSDAGKPIAAICHAPWTLLEGNLVCGRTLTSWPSLQTDLRNGGATWVDQEVVVCGDGSNTLLTSRRPADLPSFCREMTAVFAHTRVLTSTG